MKKFLKILMSAGIALIPLAIVILLYIVTDMDLGISSNMTEEDTMAGLMFLVMGGGGWMVCTFLFYFLSDFDTFDVSNMDHPKVFRIFWALMAIFAIGGTAALIMQWDSIYKFTEEDLGFKTYLAIALSPSVAAFIFTHFLSRKFGFERFFFRYLFPIAAFGGMLVISLIFYLIGKNVPDARTALWLIPIEVGVLTLPVMGVMSFGEFFEFGSSGRSSGGSSGGGYSGHTGSVEEIIGNVYVYSGNIHGFVTSISDGGIDMKGKLTITFKIRVTSDYGGLAHTITSSQINLMISEAKNEIARRARRIAGVRSVSVGCDDYTTD